jgi:hypothetical protein
MLLIVGVWLLPAVARGTSAPQTDSQAQFQLGTRDEEERSFAAALAHYRACVDAAPFGRPARSARGRITWIEERSEGNFAPLTTLAAVRQDAGSLGEGAAVDRFAVQTESFPPGLVRSELRVRMAEAWLKLGRRTEAVGELRRVVSDSSSGDADRVFAERDLVETLLADGQLDVAREEVGAHPFDPKAMAEVGRLVRRRLLHRAIAASLLLLFVVTIGTVVRTGRRRITTAWSGVHPS